MPPARGAGTKVGARTLVTGGGGFIGQHLVRLLCERGARVRVLINSKDLKSEWGTVGVSENIIEASWQALVDAVEYKLLKKNGRSTRVKLKKRRVP